MIVGRAFGQGTLLEVELQRSNGSYSAWLPTRVIHGTKQDEQTWLVGCAFVTKLTDEEMQALL